MPPPVSETLLVELELKQLKEPTFYAVLFGLNATVEQDLLPDEITKVRPLNTRGDSYEIITGVERYRLACEQGAQTITAVVKDMTEEEARRYATDEFLRSAAFSSRSLIQLLVIAKDNEGRGGDWGVERLTQFLKIKRSTYTHAWSSISFVCDLLRSSDPEAAQLGLAELVALAVRKNFLPEFTDLYAGRMSVDRFYREVYRASELGRRRSQQQREAKSKKRLWRDADASASADGSEMGSSALSPAIVRPRQLVAEAVLKLAEAAAASGNDADNAGDDGGQALDQLLVNVIDTHPDLAVAIRQVCKLVLKHLDGDGRGQQSRRRPTRSAQPAPHGTSQQLSFELPSVTERADEHA
jgi:hypothetical protein